MSLVEQFECEFEEMLGQLVSARPGIFSNQSQMSGQGGVRLQAVRKRRYCTVPVIQGYTPQIAIAARVESGAVLCPVLRERSSDLRLALHLVNVR
jgi:hypothetical protein